MSRGNRKYELRVRADQLAETRRRIVEATAALHEEVGPARTTVAEIARRAGVRRPTVYNHFPEETELFLACGQYSLTQNPPPDPSTALAMSDPGERLHGVLAAFYAWYRRVRRGREYLERDRLVLPALDAAMRIRLDQAMAALADTLTAGFSLPAATEKTLRAMVSLALDFWTWRRLATEGLSDDDAAAVMTSAVTAACRTPPREPLKSRT